MRYATNIKTATAKEDEFHGSPDIEDWLETHAHLVALLKNRSSLGNPTPCPELL